MKIKICLAATILFMGTDMVAQARYYDASVGRFVSPDSIVPNASDPQAYNRYAYVRNNPVNLTDPSGHSWLSKQVHKVNHWADNNPLGAFAAQSFFPFIGTSLLTRTETGRNIIAGEIIIGTAIGTLMMGGPAWSGAMSGELIGGYSAYQSNGSVLNGVVVGGAVGAGTGYLGQQIGIVQSPVFTNPSGEAAAEAWGSHAGLTVARQFVLRGAIEQAGAGFIQAYAGGNGSLRNMLNGTLRGAVRGFAVNTAILGATYGIDKFGEGTLSIRNLQLQGEFSKERGFGTYSWQISNNADFVNLVNVDIGIAGVYSNYGNTYSAIAGAEMSSPLSMPINSITNILFDR